MTIAQNNTSVTALEYNRFFNEVVRNCAYGGVKIILFQLMTLKLKQTEIL